MQLQAGIVPNLNRSLSRYQNVKFFTGALDRQNILESLSSLGYCWYRDTNLHNDLFPQQELIDNEIDHSERVQSCLIDELQHRNRRQRSTSKQYHNELLYTNEFPRIIAFLCIKAAAVGGHTPFCNTVDVYEQLSDKMRNKFDRCGIQYVRNLMDKVAAIGVENNTLKLGGQKFMQDIFHSNDRMEIESLCELNGYEYEWNVCAINKTPILRLKYVAPAIVEYEFWDTIVRSFANSVTGMNGRYFTDYDPYVESLDYGDRPFHSLWGNGDEFSDDEYTRIEDLFDSNSIKFEWQDGDIFIADNLMWAHG
eukprot:818431_1